MSLCCSVLSGSGQLFRRRIDGARWLARPAILVPLAAALLSAPSAQTGRTITVRALNLKTGKPLKKLYVALWDPDKKGRLVGQGQTNNDGLVVVTLPEPVPARVEADLEGGQCGVSQCPPYTFSTGEIMKTGVMVKNCSKEQKIPYSTAAKPGELVIFGAPLSWWDCTKREIP